MNPTYICKNNYISSMIGKTVSGDPMVIIAIIQSEEGLPLWDLLKKSQTPQDILAKLMVKHGVLNLYGYSLVEITKGSEEGKDVVVTKDAFVKLRGEYRL